MLILVPPKGIDFLLRVLQQREPAHVQALLPKPAVEGFDRGPEVNRGADELGAVVAVDPLRQPALEAQALEGGGDVGVALSCTVTAVGIFPRTA